MIYLKGIRLNELPEETSYLADLPVVKNLIQSGGIEFSKPVTFIAGENGSGKSTLLEAISIALGFNPEGGSRDFLFSTKDSHSELYRLITTIRAAHPKDGFFLRAESFYNTASYLDETSTLMRYGNVSFHKQSHGEGFLSLIENRFLGNGIYLMDEPESALSPSRQMSLLVDIDNLVKSNSQLIIATHSPILMSYPDSEVIYLTPDRIEKVNYKETENYKITKQFINNPEQMLKYLLED